jgi:hypothetical protein
MTMTQPRTRAVQLTLKVDPAHPTRLVMTAAIGSQAGDGGFVSDADRLAVVHAGMWRRFGLAGIHRV